MIILNRRNHRAKPPEEHSFARPSPRAVYGVSCSYSMSSKIARHEIDAVEICLTNDATQWNPELLVISDRAIDRLVVIDIEFGLDTEHSGQRCLRIEINGEHAQPLQSEKMREMYRRGRLCKNRP